MEGKLVGRIDQKIDVINVADHLKMGQNITGNKYSVEEKAIPIRIRDTERTGRSKVGSLYVH